MNAGITAEGEIAMTTHEAEGITLQAASADSSDSNASTKPNTAPRKPRVAPKKAKSGEKATTAQKRAKNQKKAKPEKPAKTTEGAREGSKAAKILELLKRPDGVSHSLFSLEG
jgi:hypothetical protein